MTAWNGEEDRYVTSDKDTWVSQPKKESTVEFKVDREVTNDYLEGVADTLEACARMIADFGIASAWRETAEKTRARITK